MVMVVDVPGMVRLLKGHGVERFLAELTDYIGEDFARWPAFEKSPRAASHSSVGVIELMPTSDGTLYGFKYVNGHPINTRSGKLTVTAFGVLADVATGYPLFVAEMTLLTALRTAATSALAARHLARPESTVMALIGTGAQAEFQALAFKAVNGVKRIRYYDVDPAAMQKFARNLAGSGLVLEAADSATDAAAGADIITTATAAKSRIELVTEAMVTPGMHLNAIGGDCPGKTEVAAGVLERARIFVEYTPQTLIEGEIQSRPGAAVTELWEVVAGRKPGRQSPAEVTLFDSVGFAIEDFAALRYVHDLARSRSEAAELALVPQVSDPKDLYGLLI
jgi:ornithine cyclodeaminase